MCGAGRSRKSGESAGQRGRENKKGGAEAPPFSMELQDCLVNQRFRSLRCTEVQARVIEDEAEVTLGNTRARGSTTQRANERVGVAVLERSLRNDVALESGSPVIQTIRTS